MENQEFIKLIEDLKTAGLVYNDADLCRKVGCTKSFLSEMKNGRRVITEQFVTRLHNTFPDFFNIETGKNENKTDVSRLVDVIMAQNETIGRMADTKDAQIASLLSIIEALSGAEKKSAS